MFNLDISLVSSSTREEKFHIYKTHVILLACVAGRRKEGKSKRSSRVRSSSASRARLSSFLPLRTPATQAVILLITQTY